MKHNILFYILAVLIIFISCNNEKNNAAIVTLDNFFKYSADSHHDRALTYVDSSSIESYKVLINYIDSNFVKNIQYVKTDTINNLFRIQVLIRKSVSYWWLKKTTKGFRIVQPAQEITKDWLTFENKDLKLLVSPSLSDNKNDNTNEKNAELIQNMIDFMKNNLHITKINEILYFHCGSSAELSDLAGSPPSSYISGHLGHTTQNGNIFTIKSVDTLEIITAILKNETLKFTPFFPIGLYIVYGMNNKWNGLSTHCWVTAYPNDSTIISSQNLILDRNDICSSRQPDVSWIIAASLTDFIIHEYGLETFITLMRLITPDIKITDTYMKLFGLTPQQLDIKWIRYANKESQKYLNKFTITKQIEYRNYKLNYAIELEPIINSTLNQLDSINKAIGKYFNKSLNDTIKLYVLTSLSGNYLFPGWNTGGGGSQDTIYIRSNILGDNFKQETGNIMAITMHELVHYVVSGNQNEVELISRWLNEGLAYYMTSILYPFHSPVYELDLIRYYSRNHIPFYNIEQLNNSWSPKDGIDPRLALQVSFYFVKFLITKYGWVKMNIFLKKLKELNYDLNQSSLSAYGKNIKDLETIWKKSIK